MDDQSVTPLVEGQIPGPIVPHDIEPSRVRPHVGPHNGGALETGRSLDDAECLLHYASHAGIPISNDVMAPIFAAREAQAHGHPQPAVVIAFLSAYATLAAKLAPVTAETVRASNEQIGTVVKRRGTSAVLTTVIVVLLSVVLFITNSIGDNIADGIKKTNDMAASARLHVGAPAIGNMADEMCGEATALPNPPIQLAPPLTEQTMIVELQQFASSIRDLETQAIKLNRFVASLEDNPFSAAYATTSPKALWANPQEALELPPSLSNFRSAALCKIAVYQQVRNFAQNVAADSALFYGSLGKYVLPVLFALLGAFAYNLRDYSNRVRSRTYHRSYVEAARIIVSLIAGAMIGYFGTFAAGLNLLAAAFLVGYGVEIFFAFLDTLLVSFGAKKPVATPSGGGSQT